MMRFAFNRYKEGVAYKDIYNLLGKIFPETSSHYRNCATRYAHAIFKLNENKKVYFGQYKRFQRGLITKEKYKETKNIGIYSEGESPYKGNRFFQLDIENGKVIFKRSRNEHYDLILVENTKGRRRDLL